MRTHMIHTQKPIVKRDTDLDALSKAMQQKDPLKIAMIIRDGLKRDDSHKEKQI